MVAQTLGGPKPLQYAALGACMIQVVKRNHMAGNRGQFDPGYDGERHNFFEIWCPKFGSGLAGGSWPHIEEMIRETWVESFGIDVTVFTR